MMKSTVSDTFQTPTVLNRDHLSFCEMTVKGVQDWVSSLSILQLGDSCQSLFNALLEVSELNCPETMRFDLIQTLHSSLENVLASLEKHFAHQSLISSDRNEHIIELAMLLRSYFAKIYLDIARRSNQQLQQQKFSFFAFKQKKNLQMARALATFYSLQQLTSLLYQQQMLYSHPVPGQWLAAHQLYQIAIENDYHQQNLNPLKGSANNLQSIQQAYAQLILLDIFSTHQVRQSEIHALYECSFDWARMIQIQTHETALSKYIVDIHQDQRPVYNKKQEDGFQPTFFIATQNLLDHINNTLNKNAEYLSKNEKLFLSPALKFHVQNILGNIVERQHERYEYSAQLQLCFSLMTAHFYLSQAKNFHETLMMNHRGGMHSESRLLSDWDNSGASISTSSSKMLDREAKQIYQTEVLDISVNGYRIKWSGETPKNLRTGEFILIQENNQGQWRGGVIRWIKQSTEKTLELGLEVLAQHLYPCAVHQKPERHINNYYPALLLQNQQLDEIKTTILLPNLQTFKEQQVIYLRLGKEELKVDLLKTVAITQSFMQFDFELLNDEQQPIVDQFIDQKANELKNHDLWEALK